MWVVLSTLLLLAAVYKLSRVGSRPSGYPPGPRTLPFIGNLHQMPSKDGYRQLKKWADEYGDIYSVILGTTVLIVLSSAEVVNDLVDKRGSIYSSRPDMEMMRLLSGGENRMTFMVSVFNAPYGDDWRLIRKLYQSTLSVKAADSHVPYQDLESRQLLVGFLDAPELFESHIKRYTNSQTTQTVYGFRTTSIHDPQLKQFFESFEEVMLAASNTAAALLDVYPVLRRLPEFLVPIKRRAKSLHETEKTLYMGHWLAAKKAAEKDTLKPCFCLDLHKAQQEQGFSDYLAMYMSGVQLEGGTDTSTAELIAFIMAMLLFPDVQKAAQNEIDGVCGDRLPRMEDQASLPYIRACVKETLRWFPTAVLALPHALSQDDQYRGYHIPKKATIAINAWNIQQNPSRYPNPSEFDPSRFVEDNKTLHSAATSPDISQRDIFGFGAGRRTCPGIHVVERSLFLAVARLLWAFRFERALDGEGNEVLPDPSAVTQGSLIQPMPFPVRIIPRSLLHAEMVRKQWQDAQNYLDEEGQWLEEPPAEGISH